VAIIVSDTSAIRALHHLGKLDLISRLYGRLIVPPAVHDELRLATRNFVAIDLVKLGLAAVQTPSRPFVIRVAAFHLDAGEIEAIALALELPADYLLIDETRGRAAAKSLGVKHVGVLGVLMEAKRRGFIDRVAPLLKRLRLELRFHINPQFEKEVLKDIGELPEP
jgi:predicted nucleic acid-binding protein